MAARTSARCGNRVRPMASGWWDASGTISGCVAAYSPVGAADLAASYVNLQNPGTYNAAPVGGSAPTHASATGWGHNGTSQYLSTGLTPTNDGTWTILARWSGTSGNNRTPIGFYTTGGAMLIGSSAANVSVYNGLHYPAGIAPNTPQLAGGVYGFAGKTAYRNGVAEAVAIPAGSGPAFPLLIGALNLNGSSAIQHFLGDIQAIAVYSVTLTAGQMATVSASMAALPVASAKGLPIIAHHHRQVWG